MELGYRSSTQTVKFEYFLNYFHYVQWIQRPKVSNQKGLIDLILFLDHKVTGNR